MFPDPPTMTVPLRTDINGVIRVSSTRVTLETLIDFYMQGESPEALHQGFPTIPLTDIYAVIAYFLAHQDSLNAYLESRKNVAERTRKQVEAQNPPLDRIQLQQRSE